MSGAVRVFILYYFAATIVVSGYRSAAAAARVEHSASTFEVHVEDSPKLRDGFPKFRHAQKKEFTADGELPEVAVTPAPTGELTEFVETSSHTQSGVSSSHSRSPPQLL